MRVISEDGVYDFPYEQIVVSIDKVNPTMILAWHPLCKDEECICIAKYSTEEKAIKAVEMLRDVYEHGIFVPNDKYDPNDTENWLTNTKGFYHHTLLFQFPADDEIEV
jgi:hypothetical protein